MREARTRPGATGDAEVPQSADAGDADGGAGAQQQQQARAQRAHKRRDAAADAEATAFNERHAAEVAEFNQLTQNACLGEDGKPDPAAVKDWQREHNVAPDGKIGPKTLAAAGGKDAQDGKADQQVASASAGPKPKARGPIEEIVSWLDLDTVKHALAHLEDLAQQAKAPAAGGDANRESAKDDAGKPDATGLASNVSLNRFVAAAKKLESEHQWKKLTRDQRAIHMVGAANDELAAAGVRPIHHRFSDELNVSNPGRFVHELWRMELSKALFSQAKLKPGQGADLADTIYHEARHAEQNYRIVQLLAGQKKSVDEIKELTHIDQETIKIAHQQPIEPPAGAHAQALFDDKYGAGKEHHHDAEVAAKEKLKAYHDVLVRLESKDATPEEKEAAQKQLEAMKPEAMAAWNAYSTLATEADAFAVGNRVKAKMQ